MKTTYTEAVVKVSEVYLDQENPRFPPANSQREAVQTMLKDPLVPTLPRGNA